MMKFRNHNTGEIREHDVIDGKVICNIKTNRQWVSNPSLQQFNDLGWEEYIPPKPEPHTPTFNEVYEQKVVELIREKYDINKELALHRQRGSSEEKDAEFDEYYAYCEACKEQAREFAQAEIEKFMENIAK